MMKKSFSLLMTMILTTGQGYSFPQAEPPAQSQPIDILSPRMQLNLPGWRQTIDAAYRIPPPTGAKPGHSDPAPLIAGLRQERDKFLNTAALRFLLQKTHLQNTADNYELIAVAADEEIFTLLVKPTGPIHHTATLLVFSRKDGDYSGYAHGSLQQTISGEWKFITKSTQALKRGNGFIQRGFTLALQNEIISEVISALILSRSSHAMFHRMSADPRLRVEYREQNEAFQYHVRSVRTDSVPEQPPLGTTIRNAFPQQFNEFLRSSERNTLAAADLILAGDYGTAYERTKDALLSIPTVTTAADRSLQNILSPLLSLLDVLTDYYTPESIKGSGIMRLTKILRSWTPRVILDYTALALLQEYCAYTIQQNTISDAVSPGQEEKLTETLSTQITRSISTPDTNIMVIVSPNSKIEIYNALTGTLIAHLIFTLKTDNTSGITMTIGSQMTATEYRNRNIMTLLYSYAIVLYNIHTVFSSDTLTPGEYLFRQLKQKGLLLSRIHDDEIFLAETDPAVATRILQGMDLLRTKPPDPPRSIAAPMILNSL